MGRTVRTHINSLVVPRAGKELPEYKKILTGPWDLKFQLNYEDTSVTIPAPKSVNFNGTKATIQEATVSCVGVSVRYNIDRSIEHDNNSGKMSQNMEEYIYFPENTAGSTDDRQWAAGKEAEAPGRRASQVLPPLSYAS